MGGIHLGVTQTLSTVSYFLQQLGEVTVPFTPSLVSDLPVNRHNYFWGADEHFCTGNGNSHIEKRKIQGDFSRGSCQRTPVGKSGADAGLVFGDRLVGQPFPLCACVQSAERGGGHRIQVMKFHPLAQHLSYENGSLSLEQDICPIKTSIKQAAGKSLPEPIILPQGAFPLPRKEALAGVFGDGR